ncbi:hypothetical protein BDB01DRAFT_834573 [Pilobolus umbonatus]|nr:hypothetical protein BDB01DRAFT_834573 [Pilobolus umbonatus]
MQSQGYIAASDMCAINTHNAQKNTEGKPPYSYATLIKYAIEQSPTHKLTLSQIYDWVIQNYPYYGTAGSGWKNSIRHNLSLNKCFVRIPRPMNEPGKGSYWIVDHYALETEQRNIHRGRSTRSRSDASLDDYSLLNTNQSSSIQSKQCGGRSFQSSKGAIRNKKNYYRHPYGPFERSQSMISSSYLQQCNQQRAAHQALINTARKSSVIYSLPSSFHHENTSSNLLHNNYDHLYYINPYNDSKNTKNINSNDASHTNNKNQKQTQLHPTYTQRQSCPDLTLIYSETNMMNNAQTYFDSISSLSSPSYEDALYPPTHPHFITPYLSSEAYSTSTYSNNSTSADNVNEIYSTAPLDTSNTSYMFDESLIFDKSTVHDNPTLPSPILSPINLPDTSSLPSAADSDTVAQQSSPVTTETPVENIIMALLNDNFSPCLAMEEDHSLEANNLSSSVNFCNNNNLLTSYIDLTLLQ